MFFTNLWSTCHNAKLILFILFVYFFFWNAKSTNKSPTVSPLLTLSHHSLPPNANAVESIESIDKPITRRWQNASSALAAQMYAAQLSTQQQNMYVCVCVPCVCVCVGVWNLTKVQEELIPFKFLSYFSYVTSYALFHKNWPGHCQWAISAALNNKFRMFFKNKKQ